jgi:hypothetical protein
MGQMLDAVILSLDAQVQPGNTITAATSDACELGPPIPQTGGSLVHPPAPPLAGSGCITATW